MTVQHPYLDEASQPLRFWANKYKTRYNEDPGVYSTYGYILLDTFIKGAQKAGPDLSTDQNGLDSAPPRAYLAPDLLRQERMVECVAQQVLGSP